MPIHILVAFEESQRGRWTLEVGGALAGAAGGRLTVGHAVDPGS